MTRKILEICSETLADAVAARAGGADRLEVCARLDLDGLTPDIELVRAVKDATRLPVMAMVRPRARAFVYAAAEIDGMVAAIGRLIAAGADGLVFGVLRGDATIDGEACRRLIACCGGRIAVFHRALDQVADRVTALEQLIEVGFGRVLTSGGVACAAEAAGVSEIRRMIGQAAGRIEILPGGGVRPQNVAALVRGTGCGQAHSSARVAGRTGVDAGCVAGLRAALDGEEFEPQSGCVCRQVFLTRSS